MGVPIIYEATMKIIHGIPVFGEPLFNAVEQMESLIKPHAYKVALMADHHLGYSMPIGGVAAYESMVSPSGVGFDIGCGNKAVKLDLSPDEVRKLDIPSIMDEIWGNISFGIGNNNEDAPRSHPIFNEHEEGWRVVKEVSKAVMKGGRSLRDQSISQLGTVGGGNHYVDLFIDEDGYMWIGVHFGSRGLGHKIATYFIKKGGSKDSVNATAVLFEDDSEMGQMYIHAMKLAGAYAYVGRDWVCERVARIVGGSIISEVHNHHNFAWQEQVDGRTMWVVRKGATPAFPGQQGFIGGSMGENAVIIEGVESDEAKSALYSTVHGAGRLMSRSEAKGKVHKKTGEIKKPGKISREMMDKWIQDAGVCLRGGGVDESPHCYKRLNEVLEHHSSTIRVLHILKPVGVAMAGPNTVDPYKD